MKSNLRGKIREFIESEEGKVGVKSPLTLGLATGSVLFAHTVIAPNPAAAWQCDHGQDCDWPHICSVGTCVGG